MNAILSALKMIGLYILASLIMCVIVLGLGGACLYLACLVPWIALRCVIIVAGFCGIGVFASKMWRIILPFIIKKS